MSVSKKDMLAEFDMTIRYCKETWKAHRASHWKLCMNAIRNLIKHYPEQEVAFVRHIEKHLSGPSIPMCRICGKNILEIYDESREAGVEVEE